MSLRATVGVNAACFALLAWLYGGDLYDAARARVSEVSALSALPSVPFAVTLLVAASVAAGLTVAGVVRRRDATYKGYRVLPIVTVVGLFVDLLVLSADKPPFSSFMRAAAALELFESKAAVLVTGAGVSTDAAALEAVVQELGDAPWLVRGEGAARWRLELLTGCEGPRTEPSGAPVGTLFYCVAADGSQAWITAVGLPREERFGAPKLVSSGGQPVVGWVRRAPAEAEELPAEPPPEFPVGLPMAFEPDAGGP